MRIPAGRHPEPQWSHVGTLLVLALLLLALLTPLGALFAVLMVVLLCCAYLAINTYAFARHACGGLAAIDGLVLVGVAGGVALLGFPGAAALGLLVLGWLNVARQNATLAGRYLVAGLVLSLPVSIVVQMHQAARDRANRRATSSTLVNLAAGLAEYDSHHGAYPPQDAGLTSRPLVVYLDGDPTNGGPDRQYVDVPVDERGHVVDGWGRPLRYRENRNRLRAQGVTEAPPRRFFANGNPDPYRTNGWNWRSFDLWSYGKEPAEQDYHGNW